MEPVGWMPRMVTGEVVLDGVPSLLNLGVGRSFRADALNLDSDDLWAPDAVLDLGTIDLGPGGVVVQTERFGALRLQRGQFRQVVARSVLERTPDLRRFMTTCLALLQGDGTLDITVPYDLSLGAWQDPSHVRSFNERSWEAYVDGFWTLGWKDARFALESLSFVPSRYGEELHARGLSQDEIVRTPRAIDAMNVVLRKVVLSEADRATAIRERTRHLSLVPRAQAAVAPPPERAATGPRPFGQPWDALKHRYCIWIVSPKDYTHHRAFDDVAGALSGAFSALGGTAPVVNHPSQWSGRLPIVMAPQLLTPNLSLILPSGSILFNMEQVDRGSVWMNKVYMAVLQRHAVLDYSRRNIEALRQAGITHAELLPIGYDASLERATPAVEPDIDVLFYGSMNPRRLVVLNELLGRGVKVVHAFDCYGAARDALIARAKIVVNLHFYEAAIFESVRVSLLLANRACVVTEGDPDDPDIGVLRDGMLVCRYDDIVRACLTLLANDALRQSVAESGYLKILERRQSDFLNRLIEESVGSGV